MVTVTLFGGVSQIGGNKILVEDQDTRLFFDFGEPFCMRDKYFVDFLKPRESRFGLRDYFFFDMMPKTEGLYDEDWLRGTDLKYREPEYDAAFISHMHFDHAMHLKYMDHKIPVHLGAAADAIRKSWEETSIGRTSFGDHEFLTFRTGDKRKVGSIEVEPIHVDHSTPGAYGFIIHTSEECIAYTGDLRMHGPRGDMTVEFIKKAMDSKPDVLICEGTRVAPEDARKNLTEEGVGDKARELISGTDKLAIVSFYPKDVDRMRTFRDVARATGRKFVVSAKVANLLEALRDDSNIDSPDPLTDENMLVYVRKMASPERVKYEKRYIDIKPDSDHVVDSEYVKEHQAELIFHTDFFQLAELIDVEPEPNSLFIRSKSEPFEEDDVQEQVLLNWMDRFKLDFDSAHASGHASMEEIITIIDEISPKVVIPVHTEHPALFKKAEPKVLIPKARQGIVLGED